MKINKRFILSFVAPSMIFISAIGLLLKDNKRIDFDARITHENMKQFVEDTLANK